tara:strand:- start:8337 stop:8675 length:339 start_codon:yes stop_codon:yes gene_type:complete
VANDPLFAHALSIYFHIYALHSKRDFLWGSASTETGWQAMDRLDQQVGFQIRLHRSLKGVRQVELASEIGLKTEQLAAIEDGRWRAGASNLFQIGRALRIPVSSFFAGSERV